MRILHLSITGILFVVLNSVAFADSTLLTPLQSAPHKQGYVGLDDHDMKYPPNPAAGAQPIPPKACVAPQEIVNTVVGPSQALLSKSACNAWGCNTDCGSDIYCWTVEVPACYACIGTCTLFACNCPLKTCTQPTTVYYWSGGADGPITVLRITCGTPDWIRSN